MNRSARAAPVAQAWRLPLMVASFAVLGAMTLAWWGLSPVALFLEGKSLGARWPADVAFLIDWVAMCIAMMLPTSLPLLAAVRRMDRRHGTRLAAMTALGFLAVWSGFGLALRVLAVALAAIDPLANHLAAHQQTALGIGFLAGAFYILLPISSRCAARCRTPMSEIATGWSGGDMWRDAVRIGAVHGSTCFGCCWPQMVLLALTAMANPTWMLIAAIAMFAQKNSRYGRLAEGLTFWFLVLIGIACLSGQTILPMDSMMWRSSLIGYCRS